MRRRIALSAVAALATLALLPWPARAGVGAKPITGHRVQGTAVPGGPMTRARLRVMGADGGAQAQVGWAPTANMPVAVEETGGGLSLAGRFIVPMGYESFSPVVLNDTLQIYMASTNTWVNDVANPFPNGPWADAAICADSQNRIHVINGVDGSFLYSSHQVYNPLAPTGSRWTALRPPVTPATGPFFSQDSGCAFLNGKIYLFGGYGVVGGGSASIQTLTWVYDPVTDLWADTGMAMNLGRLWMAYTTVLGRVAFAAGGTDNLTTLQSTAATEVFDPINGWRPRANLPTSLLAPGMGAKGNQVAVWGGGTGSIGTGFLLRNKAYGCSAPCAAWADTGQNITVPRWFSAWGSGMVGATPTLFNGGGDSGGPSLNSAERNP